MSKAAATSECGGGGDDSVSFALGMEKMISAFGFLAAAYSVSLMTGVGEIVSSIWIRT